jgi:hypothetical protein
LRGMPHAAGALRQAGPFPPSPHLYCDLEGQRMTQSSRTLQTRRSVFLTAVGVLLAGASLLPQTTAAALGSPCNDAGGNNFTPRGGGTLQQLSAAGGCQDQDKFYEVLGFTNPPDNAGPPGIGDVLVEISTIIGPPDLANNLHTFRLLSPLTAEQSYTFAGTYTLRYSVEIDPEEGDNVRFTAVSLDTDVGGTAVSVNKRVYSDADSTNLIADLTSVAGSSQVANFAPDYTKVWVDETFTLAGVGQTPAGVLFTATNLYTQTSSPFPPVRVSTPGSLSLLGLALIGLVGIRARAAKTQA